VTEHACTHTILRNGVKAHKLSLYHLLKLHVDLQVSQIEKQQKALIKKSSGESYVPLLHFSEWCVCKHAQSLQ